ncbi:hypothetical protein [Rathayibacter tritici]|uniref:Gluconate permease n=1 Tax=Rathayibacter tritici TaxID=33888 RepID=A0A161IZG0_9MICO|nr:hypothetical protein [Rathayibacter tritici]AND17411.1 gluconate permease [Rathayibacter tritici]PPI50171.1 hypothetical protein C5D18_00260 [Rathayibacter tritici]
MPEWYTLGVVALAIVVVVVSIVRFRFNPVLALAVGAAAIGLLTGLGPVDTVSTMTTGFGESFLGQSVRGALTSVTVGVSLASVLALAAPLLRSLFLKPPREMPLGYATRRARRTQVASREGNSADM